MKFWRGGLMVAVLGLISSSMAFGQIYVADFSAGTVGEYETNGGVDNRSLISGLSNPNGLALSGNNIFVTNQSAGTVGEYTTSGGTVTPTFISGLNSPLAVVATATDLYVACNDGTVSEYTLLGMPVKTPLISGLSSPYFMTISGGDLFVSNMGSGTIGEYGLDGTPIKPALIKSLSQPFGIAVSGTNLYVAIYNEGNGTTISEYTTTGTLEKAAFISGVNQAPCGLAVGGAFLYVSSLSDFIGYGTIGEYTTDGATVNASLVTGLTAPFGIVVNQPPPVGTPVMPVWGLVLLGVLLAVVAARLLAEPVRDQD